MGRTYLIWIFVFLLTINIASAAEITGKITDENGEPLVGAYAFLEYQGVKAGTTTDVNGNFRITGIEPGSYHLTFSYVGGVSQSRTVSTGEEVDISLTSQILALPEVVISTSRFTQQEIDNRQTLFPVIETKPFDPQGSTFDPVYGNSEISSSEPVPIYPGNYLFLDGSKSQFDNFPLEGIYMTWYVGIPNLEFEQLLNNQDEFFYENLNNLLEDHRFFNPDYYKRRLSQLEIQMSQEDFSAGEYYVILKVTNPLDSFDNQYTWHKIDLSVTNKDYCSRGDCVEIPTSDEISDRNNPTIIGLPTEETIITPFNSNNFPTIDQPQPPGTRAYNGKWVPLQVSSWSSQESDGFPDSPSYNSPLIPSTCSVNGEVRARDTCGCLIDGVFTFDCASYTHVAEYSSSNNCEEPVEILECPTETLCTYDYGAGACKSINYDNLIETTTGIVALSQPEIKENEITITLTDNDLINSAFCDSLGINPSELEVVEPSQATGSVIKQITGFFTKITGKQTAQRSYTTTIDTTKYSELANLEFPYLTLGGRNLRFLDLDIGTALLRDFGYDERDIRVAVASSAPFYTKENSKLIILRLSTGYTITPTSILYDQVLSASRSKAVDKIGNNEAIISTLQNLYASRNPSDYLGLSFILVQTSENKFFKIDNKIYSVARGSYLVPYQPTYDVNYQLILDPTQDPDLKPYYDFASDFGGKVTYVIGNGISKAGLNVFIDPGVAIGIPVLNPSEGYYATRDLPKIEPELETIEKSFRYQNGVKFRIIPIANLKSSDSGDYKNAVYFVPEKNIIIMDNEFSTSRNLRKKPASSYQPPLADFKLSYDYEFFNRVRQREREGRVPGRDFLTGLINDISSYNSNPSARAG